MYTCRMQHCIEWLYVTSFETTKIAFVWNYTEKSFISIFYVQLEYIYSAKSKTKQDLQKVSTCSSKKSPQIWLYVSCSPDVH